ncbi:SDR family oxidoreductase [Legionella shakespearei]|uniref:NAD-dependent epimerase/dehydratase n=1 Tax=Legionella shakespearei DSM 23087 TaxID=1122169 RepID=A0A0W0Z0P8_9GAMM|nr:SDR family oxidoreductase [Legionella shakespearei]KTD62680.1 NAD-dependent epimerase/dehydratase [Legionella shakespearei DSM 23087]
MHHLILGYGYCGYYLAQILLRENLQVTAVSRHLDENMQQAGLNHVMHDLTSPFYWDEPETVLYYLIPPSSQGDTDSVLKHFLEQSRIQAQKIIYFGSSGVYGNHQGAWVNEESPCFIQHPRQLRRLDAEQQWLTYSKEHKTEPILLRIAGIYGPQRLPIDAAKACTPLIEESKAPLINHIYVRDLATIAYQLSQRKTSYSLYNIADGNPQPMGTLQQHVAHALGLPAAPYEPWQSAWEKASPMKREFMQGSKCLSIERLQSTLGNSLLFTSQKEAIKKSM